MRDRENALGLLGLMLLIGGSGYGLLYTPPETKMAEVMRIFFIHVPTAWNALLIATFAFALAIVVLFKKQPRRSDAALTATVEVACVYTLMLLVQGSIWGKPTWGTYWDWDPRLTSAAVMGVAFAGVLSLRSFAEGPRRKAMWTAVATIIAYVDVPIVYFSVEMTDRTLHQNLSSPTTVSSVYHWPLRANAFALLFIGIWLIIKRSRTMLMESEEDATGAPPTASSDLVAGVDG
jgi:heme exporter protein C